VLRVKLGEPGHVARTGEMRIIYKILEEIMPESKYEYPGLDRELTLELTYHETMLKA
jgi:hypothetical protein